MSASMALDVLVRLKDRLSGPLSRLAANLQRFGSLVRRIGTTLGRLSLVGFAGLTAAATAMGTSVLRTGMQFEQFEAVLKTLTGSSGKAKAAMAWVQQFAKTTPYELAEVTDAFVKLNSYGLDPQGGLMLSVGNMAAGMGKSLDQAVEAVADAVNGENERLKEFGIKASKDGERFTYTFTHQGKQISLTAKNTVADIQRVLQTIMDMKFTGAMDEQSRTLGGILSNIGDTWTGFQKMIGDAGFFDAVKAEMQGVLDQLNAWGEDGTLKAVARTISTGLVTALKALKRAGKEAFDWLRTVDWRGVGADLMSLGRGLGSVLGALGRAGRGTIRFFRELGSIGDGGFAETARSVAGAVRSLVGGLDGASLTALGVGAAVLVKFGLSLGRFALGGRGLKLALIVAGLAGLTKAGGEMTAVDWAGAALGIGLLAGPIVKLAGALRGLAGASAGTAVLGEVAGAGAGAAAGKGLWGALAARLATLAVPAALAAGAGWALWSGPQRQPESERAGYSSRGREASADPLAISGELSRLLSVLQGMRFVADGLSKTDGSTPIAQRRGEDLSGRIGAIDAAIAELRRSGQVESGTARAQLDAILSLRAEISALVPRLVPGVVAGGKEGRPAEAPGFWSGMEGQFAKVLASAVEGVKAAMKALPSDMRPPVPTPRPNLPDLDVPVPTIRPDFVKPIEIEGEAAAAKADAIGSRIFDAFSITATPIVDTGSIDAARSKVDGLAKALRSLPGAAMGAAPAGRQPGAMAPSASTFTPPAASPTQATLQKIAVSRDTTIVGNIKVQVDGPGKVTDTKFAASPDRGRAVGRA